MADAIGSLFIDLSMQTASFDAATKRVETQVKGLTTKITAGFGALKGVIAGSGLVLAAQQAYQAAQSFAAAGEAASNLASTLGLSVRQVVELQGVFKLTTGSLEEASAAMLRLNGVVADARGGQEAAIANFKAIGISLQDLARVGDDPMEMLKLLADRWVAYSDTASKSAVFTDIFGRSIGKLVPLLKDGAEGIDANVEKFRKLDPSAEAAQKKAAELDDKLDELSVTIKGQLNDALVQLSPLFDGAGADADGFAARLRTTKDEIIAVANAVQGLIGWLGRLAGFDPVRDALHGKEVARINIPGIPGGGPAGLSEMGEVKQYLGPAGWQSKPAVTPPPKGGGGGKKKGGGKEDEVDKEWKEAIATFKELAEEAEEAALAMADGMKDISDELFDRRVKQIRNQLDLEKISGREAVDAERKVAEEKWEAHKEFYRQKREAAEGDKKKLADLDRQEKLEHEKHLTELGQLDHDKVKLRFDDFKDAARDLGNVLENSFSNAFDGITDGTFKLRTAIGGLLKDLGRMIASKAFQMLLNGGSSSSSGGGLLGSLFGMFTGGGGGGKGGLFGDGWSAAELGMPALASGGSFRVGGSGGIDSQLIAARMTPGELVEVTPPGQAGGMGGGEVIRIDLNPSEAWVSGIADQRVVTRSGQIVQVAVSQSTKAVQRNWAGMSGEASQRQL